MCDEILCMTEYEEICYSFDKIANLFVDSFSVCVESPTSELVDETAMIIPIRNRLKESKIADEIILRIKKILTTNEFGILSLKSRVSNFTNTYVGRLINIDVANPLTQSLVSSLLYVFGMYNIDKNRFDDENLKLFANNFLALLKNEAIALNNFLFDCRDLEGQRMPLFTIFDDKMATHLNSGILPEVDFERLQPIYIY